MDRKNNIKSYYNDLKEIYKDLQKSNIEQDKEKFEDVPKELSDKDKEGSYKKASYMEFYQRLKFFITTEEQVQPSGMVSKHKDYVR